MKIEINGIEILISRCEDEYLIDAFKGDTFVCSFALDAPLEALDLFEDIEKELNKY